MKNVLYLIAMTPLFVSFIFVILLAVFTCPFLLLAKILSMVLPPRYGKLLLHSTCEAYLVPAYSLREACEFVDRLFGKE